MYLFCIISLILNPLIDMNLVLVILMLGIRWPFIFTFTVLVIVFFAFSSLFTLCTQSIQPMSILNQASCASMNLRINSFLNQNLSPCPSCFSNIYWRQSSNFCLLSCRLLSQEKEVDGAEIRTADLLIQTPQLHWIPIIYFLMSGINFQKAKLEYKIAMLLSICLLVYKFFFNVHS